MHFIRKTLAYGTLTIRHILGDEQVVDIFTKKLPHMGFRSLRSKLHVHSVSTSAFERVLDVNQEI